MSSLKDILREYNLNISTNKFGTDKGDFKSYIDKFYELFFKKFRNKKINLLEIGFRHGASLFLWSRYFKKGNILGLDNNSDFSLKDNKYVEDWINNENIEIIICDAYDKKVSKKIQKTFDFIIDDGPHTISSQILSIKRYFAKLNKNGFLIIEDLIYGYFTCIVLLIFTPLNGEITIFNFRKDKPGRDNMIFLIKNKKYSFHTIFKRIVLFINCIFKIPNELLYKYYKLKSD